MEDMIPNNWAFPDHGDDTSSISSSLSGGSTELATFLVVIIATARYLLHRYARSALLRRPLRDAEYTGAEWTHRILTGHPALAVEVCRMDACVFKALLARLTTPNHHGHCLVDGRKIKAQEQLMMFMYWVANRSFNRPLQERFQRSGERVSFYLHRVLDMIYELAPDYIRLPAPDSPDHWRIRGSENGKFRAFEGCLGALDGTHIPAFVSEKLAIPWRSRKGGTTQNVLGVCDFDGKFVYILAGWEGSAHDGIVYGDALSQGFSVPHGRYYLGDAGFGSDYNILPPYRGVRYHLKEWGHGRKA